MKLGTCNVRSLYRAGSLKAAARELGRYKLDVVGVQVVRWDKGGKVREGDYDFFYEKGNSIQEKRSKSFGAEYFSSGLLPNNIKFQKYRNLMLCVVFFFLI